MLRKDLMLKADNHYALEISNLCNKLRQEVVDTNKKQILLTQQFNQFYDSIQAPKMKFMMEVLEKRLESLESKVNEEENIDLEIPDTVKKMYVTRETPKQQLRLADILPKNINPGIRHNKRFSTLTPNKK